MRENQRGPDYICVDLFSIISALESYPNNRTLYALFPIQDIIQSILCVNHYLDNQFVWIEMERRFNDDYESLDFEVLSIFIDVLTQDIDSSIRSQVPANIDSGEYVFDRWVSRTSLVLRRDGTIH